MQTTEEFTPPPESGATGEVTEAYARIWRRLGPFVTLGARSLARDRNEREELIQEARVKLWEIGSSRCDITDRGDVRVIQRILMNHMRKVARMRLNDGGDERDTVPPDLIKGLAGLDREHVEDVTMLTDSVD